MHVQYFAFTVCFSPRLVQRRPSTAQQAWMYCLLVAHACMLARTCRQFTGYSCLFTYACIYSVELAALHHGRRPRRVLHVHSKRSSRPSLEWILFKQSNNRAQTNKGIHTRTRISAVWQNRDKSKMQKMYFRAATTIISFSLFGTWGFLRVSSANYPGGVALEELHTMERCNSCFFQ